jgi:hypothetical protein
MNIDKFIQACNIEDHIPVLEYCPDCAHCKNETCEINPEYYAESGYCDDFGGKEQ